MAQVSPIREYAGEVHAVEELEYNVEIRGLTKRYREVTALDGLDLRVRRGEVYGFVGPNGAGKTTAMRYLVGLIRPTSGSANVLGLPAGSKGALASTGAMIEEPAFYPYLSGRDNLRVLARIASAPAERIDGVLDAVDLTSSAHRAFSGYSMGMKQRLGVAAALLKEPQLLILDEPTNGLDPEGISDMRVLLRGLAEQGRTVMLSSHLTSEVELICDRIGIVHRGRLVAEGPLEDLRGQPEIKVRVNRVLHAYEVLRPLPFIQTIREDGDLLYVRSNVENAPAINRRLVEAGIAVSELTPATQSLEQVFLEMVNEWRPNDEHLPR